MSEDEQGVVSLETTPATCSPKRLLDLLSISSSLRNSCGLVKALAKNHQFLGVNNAIEAVKDAREREDVWVCSGIHRVW